MIYTLCLLQGLYLGLLLSLRNHDSFQTWVVWGDRCSRQIARMSYSDKRAAFWLSLQAECPRLHIFLIKIQCTWAYYLHFTICSPISPSPLPYPCFAYAAQCISKQQILNTRVIRNLILSLCLVSSPFPITHPDAATLLETNIFWPPEISQILCQYSMPIL